MEETSTPSHRKRDILIITVSIVVIIAAAIITVVFLNKAAGSPAASNPPIAALKTPTVSPRLIASGLESPTGIVSTPSTSDKRLFIIERVGLVRTLIPSDSSASKVFLDIRQKVRAEGEMGLLGLAFHPNYEQNGYLFVNYIDKNQNTIIARYKASTDSVDTSSEKILLTLKQPYANHNGGDLTFGPDGYLYAALGDGGSAGDPENRAQSKDNLFGKILRLDVDKGTTYTIPTTNPFVDQSGTKPEIWAYGLRNPWRMSFDRLTGDLYIADVGQGDLEEINVQKSDSRGGENYGWRCYEGSKSFKLTVCEDAATYVQPIIEYNHEEDRCSITGGYVYRGSKYPALTGKYFYGDYCSGQLFYAVATNGTWTQTLAVKTDYSISAFGEGSDGELYVADFKTGNIYHLQDTANP